MRVAYYLWGSIFSCNLVLMYKEEKEWKKMNRKRPKSEGQRHVGRYLLNLAQWMLLASPCSTMKSLCGAASSTALRDGICRISLAAGLQFSALISRFFEGELPDAAVLQ